MPAANSGLLRSSRIVASSCDVLASRFMMSPLAANTKGGFAAARNLLSRAPRFAPYKPSFLPRSVNVKEERTTASNFGEGPAFKFPERHVSWPRFSVQSISHPRRNLHGQNTLGPGMSFAVRNCGGSARALYRGPRLASYSGQS